MITAIAGTILTPIYQGFYRFKQDQENATDTSTDY